MSSFANIDKKNRTTQASIFSHINNQNVDKDEITDFIGQGLRGVN